MVKENYIPSTVLVDKLPEICVNLDLISVYDAQCKSIPEMLYMLAQKLNETICNMEHNDKVLQAQLDQLSKELDYLLGEGLLEELTKIFEKMYADGTLQALVEGAIVDIKRRLDKIEEVLKLIKVDTNRVIIGYDAAKENPALPNDASYNLVVIGNEAQPKINRNQIAIGTRALKNCESSRYNIAIGLETLFSTTGTEGSSTAGTRNTALGHNAGRFNTNGYSNIMMGRNSYQNMNGNFNVALGSGAMSGNCPLDLDGEIKNKEPKVGNSNTAIGTNALYAATGSSNVAVGADALREAKNADRNLAIGTGALSKLQSDIDIFGKNKVSVDKSATYIWSGETVVIECPEHTVVSGDKVDIKFTTGLASSITAGDTILYDISNVTSNSFTITSPKSGDATGSCIIVSKRTGIADPTKKADYNTVIGIEARRDSLYGVGNVNIGLQSALKANGSENVSIGMYSLLNAATSEKNTAIGYRTLSFGATAGSGNTAVGNLAGSHLEGTNCTAIGASAMRNADGSDYSRNVNNSIAIGYNARVKGDNECRIGDGALKVVGTYGDFETLGTNTGFILKSPNGSRYRITVSDAGALSATRL